MKTFLVQLALWAVGILSIVSCGSQQAEYTREMGALASTNVEVASTTQNSAAQDPVPEWKRVRPYLAPSLHLMGKPASELKGLLGEPKGAGLKPNFYESRENAHDSLLYEWELPAKDDPVRKQRDSLGRITTLKVDLRLAIGNTSKAVEALWVDWDNHELPSMPTIIKEMNLENVSYEMYWEDAFGESYHIVWVSFNDDTMIKIGGDYIGELLKTRTETDLETGKSKKFTSSSPEYSIDKVGVRYVYVGPKDINPFDPFGHKPSVNGVLLSATVKGGG